MFSIINRAIKAIYEKKGTPLLGILIVGIFILESRYELRKRKASKPKRLIKNGGVAATAALGFRYFLIPALVWASMKSESKKGGLLIQLPIPMLSKNILGFFMLDYGNYIWHRLSHNIPDLWRFHQVHHTDLDLDISTAFRFHIGEIMPSAFFRAAVVWMLGLNWKWVLYYEIAFEAANSFHHSNLKLPQAFAKLLPNFIVTPEMHGIHHSIIREEADSNFSVIFSFWDKLHQTLKLDIKQNEIDIGIPAFRNDNELSFMTLILMPFRKQKRWELPDGTVPKRISTI